MTQLLLLTAVKNAADFVWRYVDQRNCLSSYNLMIFGFRFIYVGCFLHRATTFPVVLSLGSLSRSHWIRVVFQVFGVAVSFDVRD